MRLHAKRRASHLTWTGAALVGAGIALGAPDIVSAGAAVIAGIAVSRGLTLVSVARARAAGFEMVWNTGERARRGSRQQPLVLEAELRNRDALPTRFRALSAMHAPDLEVEVSPREGEIPATGKLRVQLTVTPLRVGYHGIHGLTLETIRAPGLFSVPLSFSNPFVLEVLPRGVALSVVSSRGQAGHHQAPEGGGGRLRGDGPEFRELREHRPGDPFRDIAWRASAKRGRLLVVDKEQQQREAVWLFAEASSDSFSGPPGRAGADDTIDATLRTAEGHLARGDLVGLCVVGPKHSKLVPLGRGPRHAAQLLSTLAFETHTVHADCSDWDERDVSRRVLEHARSLDPRAEDLRLGDDLGLLNLAKQLLERAPVQPREPFAEHSHQRLLRRYLLAFGIHPPPKTTSDRHATQRRLARALREATSGRPRPGIFYVLASAPTLETPPELIEALRACARARIRVQFVPQQDRLPLPEEDMGEKQRLAHDALRERLDLALAQGTRRLRQVGVTVVSGHRQRAYLRRRTSARSMTS